MKKEQKCLFYYAQKEPNFQSLAVINLNKSKANNMEQIINLLDKQNIVLHQIACEEKQCLGSTKGIF